MIAAPSKAAMESTRNVFLLRSAIAASNAITATAPGLIQLCSRAPAQTAPPSARARLSITRATSL